MPRDTNDTEFNPGTSAIVAVAHAQRAEAMRDAFASMPRALLAMCRRVLAWLTVSAHREGTP